MPIYSFNYTYSSCNCINAVDLYTINMRKMIYHYVLKWLSQNKLIITHFLLLHMLMKYNCIRNKFF